MAQQQPVTLQAFKQLSGVGDRKLAQYGEPFIEVIQAYRQERGLVTEQNVAEQDKVQSLSSISKTLSNTQLQTVQLFQQGLSLEDIAQKRTLKLTTILNHLSEAIALGEPIESDRLITPEAEAKISEAIAMVGLDSLRNIFDHLQEQYTYDEIRLVVAIWRRSQST
jgi:ATP-dependent DNA helicase RecQ